MIELELRPKRVFEGAHLENGACRPQPHYLVIHTCDWPTYIWFLFSTLWSEQMPTDSNPKDSNFKTLNITVENLAPPRGTVLSQLWFGFHDGSFVVYKSGSPASPALERLAEDGNTGPLTVDFNRSGSGIVQVGSIPIHIGNPVEQSHSQMIGGKHNDRD